MEQVSMIGIDPAKNSLRLRSVYRRPSGVPSRASAGSGSAVAGAARAASGVMKFVQSRRSM